MLSRIAAKSILSPSIVHRDVALAEASEMLLVAGVGTASAQPRSSLTPAPAAPPLRPISHASSGQSAADESLTALRKGLQDGWWMSGRVAKLRTVYLKSDDGVICQEALRTISAEYAVAFSRNAASGKDISCLSDAYDEAAFIAGLMLPSPYRTVMLHSFFDWCCKKVVCEAKKVKKETIDGRWDSWEGDPSAKVNSFPIAGTLHLTEKLMAEFPECKFDKERWRRSVEMACTTLLAVDCFAHEEVNEAVRGCLLKYHLPTVIADQGALNHAVTPRSSMYDMNTAEVLGMFSDLLMRGRAAGLSIDYVRAEAEQWLGDYVNNWPRRSSTPNLAWSHEMGGLERVRAFCEAEGFGWQGYFDRLIDRCAEQRLDGLLCAMELTRVFGQPLDRYIEGVRANMQQAVRGASDAERPATRAWAERGLALLARCTGTHATTRMQDS